MLCDVVVRVVRCGQAGQRGTRGMELAGGSLKAGCLSAHWEHVRLSQSVYLRRLYEFQPNIVPRWRPITVLDVGACGRFTTSLKNSGRPNLPELRASAAP